MVVDEHLVRELVVMGFPEGRARAELRAARNQVDTAMEHLLQAADDESAGCANAAGAV